MAKSTRNSGAGKGRLKGLWKPRLYLFTTLFLVGGGAGLAWGSWRNLCATCPSVAQIRTWEPLQTSKLFSHDGQLLTELGFERKTPVSIHALPDYVAQSVVAIEDQRFYQHRGYDLRGIARGGWGRLTGRNLGGGSTVTQQLARNMFEERIGFERRGILGYTRKLKELQVALEIERSYTKDQILEAYINEVYMGRGWGFQSAARGYFGKNLVDVNPAEAALLAAIVNSPGTYNPYTRPDNARSRRNLVLTRMTDQAYLSAEEAARWKEWPLPTEDHSSSTLHGIAPYFEEWVRQILDSRFGYEVYQGGLRVYTTLDMDMQRAAQESMEWGWAHIEEQANFLHHPYEDYDTVESFPGQTPYLQGAFIALDPYTGHVRALIGGRDFEHSKFDRARLARRQAGSSFKPFVYAAAIASGIPASHIVVDQPVVYPQVDGTEWRPKNFDPEFLGPITIRHGLRRSINMVAIKLGWEEVGIETVAQLARRMGLQTEIERFPSTTIGAVEVIPIQVAEAYSAFATLGTKVRPFPIVRVESAQGEVLWEPQPERTQVLDSLPARIIVDMLQDAANRGTGANHRHPGIPGTLPYASPVPTGGKTGTTNDGTDTWFNGFTPNLVATVWFGMDRPVAIARPVSPQATGGFYAAPVWGRFVRHVYYGSQEDGTPGEVVRVDMPMRSTPAAGGDDLTTVDSLAALFEELAAAESEPAEGPDSVDAEAVVLDSAALDSLRADSLMSALHGVVWAGGSLPLPLPWPIPEGLTTREVDIRSGKLWSQWCRDPEENRYTELYIPGTEPTDYCDDTGSRIFRIPRIRR
jgi:penicillin-binding protein 1A